MILQVHCPHIRFRSPGSLAIVKSNPRKESSRLSYLKWQAIACYGKGEVKEVEDKMVEGVGRRKRGGNFGRLPQCRSEKQKKVVSEVCLVLVASIVGPAACRRY
jgi:hypothetical protein